MVSNEKIDELVKDYFSKTNILNKQEYSVGDRVAYWEWGKTERYKRTDSSYLAENELVEIGAPTIDSLFKKINDSKTIIEPEIPDGRPVVPAEGEYTFSTDIKKMREKTVEDKELGSGRLWEEIVAYTFFKMFKQHDQESISGKIKEQLFKYYGDMVNQRYEGMTLIDGTQFASVVQVITFLNFTPKYPLLIEEFKEIYEKEKDPHSYSMKYNEAQLETPQKVIFVALAYLAKNEKKLALDYIKAEAERLKPGSLSLSFLEKNKIVERGRFFSRLKKALQSEYGTKEYLDIKGSLPDLFPPEA